MAKPYTDQWFEACAETLRSRINSISGTLDINDAKRIAYATYDVFDKLDLPTENIISTASQYIGKEIDEKLKDVIAYQLAARVQELAIRPIVMFTQLAMQEWCLLEIVNVEEGSYKGDLGVNVTFFVLTGRPAGHSFTRSFPMRWVSYLAYQIGFNKSMLYEYEPHTITGLQITGLLGPSKFNEKDIDILEWKISDSVKKRNRHILYKRMRHFANTERQAERGECPYALDTECKDCTKLPEECPASYIRKYYDRQANAVY